MTPKHLKTIFTADRQLDDIARARIWASLSARVTAAKPPRRRWPLVVGASGLAIAAAAAVLVLVRKPAPVEHLVPLEGVLALPIGPATRAVVEGPAHIVVQHEGVRTQLQLRTGTMYADFTGGGGRSLRIEAAGATIEVVGTQFSVSVNDDTACLAVAHGRVRMTSGGVTVYVEGGQRACSVRGTSPGALSAVDPATQVAFGRYQRTWLAGREESSTAAAPPAPSPAVAAVRPEVLEQQPRRAAHADPPLSPRPADVATTTAPAHTSAPAATHKAPAVTDDALAPTDNPPSRRENAAAAIAQPAAPEAAHPDKELYAAADEAIARGDEGDADRALADLLEHSPDSPLADEARYERARLAFDRRDWPAVRELVATVQPRSPLREPAAYLGCRAALEIGTPEARECLSHYVAVFPTGAHAVDAHVHLVELAYRVGGCDAVVGPLAELKRVAPRAAVIETWHRRCGPP